MSCSKQDIKKLVPKIYAFTAAFLVAILCGRLLPKEPLNLFPLAVFLSPLPIVNFVFY